MCEQSNGQADALCQPGDSLAMMVFKLKFFYNQSKSTNDKTRAHGRDEEADEARRAAGKEVRLRPLDTQPKRDAHLKIYISEELPKYMNIPDVIPSRKVLAGRGLGHFNEETDRKVIEVAREKAAAMDMDVSALSFEIAMEHGQAMDDIAEEHLLQQVGGGRSLQLEVERAIRVREHPRAHRDVFLEV